MPSSSTSTSHPRQRHPKSLKAAVAFTAAAALLVLAPLPSAHAALLRGGEPIAQSPQHELPNEGRQLLPVDNEEDDASMQEERSLTDNDGVVKIDLFKTKLLAKTFPYHMKFNRDNQISSAVTSYLVTYLEENTEETVTNLGLNCERSEEQLQWVLSCDGMAAFEEGRQPNANDFNAAVRQAFVGTRRNVFLERMYPKYEMIREKKEWDHEKEVRMVGRRRGGGGGRQKKKGKNKKNKPKKNMKGKNKKPKKEQMMKPQSSSGGGKQENVMGYTSGQPGMNQMNAGSKGYAIKNGNIHVYIDDDKRRRRRRK